MSHELYYTSAPKGLQTGSRGFCTVACTKGMPTPLIEKVEALSGYRPLFPPSDPKAALNPVSHAHVLITVAGKPYHVLSRTSAAGLDYTDRTNKFAHHVVLEAHELSPAGPAAVMRQPGFLESKWDGQVRHLPTGRTPQRGDMPAGPCREWQRLVGDAGWAGVVADSFLKNPDRPVYFLFEPGTDLLPLIAEAIALLPAEQRWQVTFNTYLTGLPAGMACSWRGVPRNSEDAATAKRIPGALQITVGEKMAAPPPGPAVDAARAGRSVSAAMPTAAPVALAVPALPVQIPQAGSHHGAPRLPSFDGRVPGLSIPTTPAPPPLPSAQEPRAGGRGSGKSLVVGMAMGLLVAAATTGVGVQGGWLTVNHGIDALPLVSGGETKLDVNSKVAATSNDLAVDNEKLKEKVKDLESKLEQRDTIYEAASQEKTRAIENSKAQQAKAEKAIAENLKLQEQIRSQVSAKPADPDIQKKYEKLEKDSAELQKLAKSQEAEIKTLKAQATGTSKRSDSQAPPNVVVSQFDFLVKKSSDHLKLSKEKKISLDMVPFPDVMSLRDKNNFAYEIKKERKEDLLTLQVQFKNPVRGKFVSLNIVRLDIRDGKLHFDWIEHKREEIDAFERKVVEDSQPFLKEILRNQVVLVTPDGEKPIGVGLRGAPAHKNWNASISALTQSEFGKLIDGFGNRYFDDSRKVAPLQVYRWDWEIRSDGARYKPQSGARIYLVVRDWLVELHGYE